MTKIIKLLITTTLITSVASMMAMEPDSNDRAQGINKQYIDKLSPESKLMHPLIFQLPPELKQELLKFMLRQHSSDIVKLSLDAQKHNNNGKIPHKTSLYSHFGLRNDTQFDSITFDTNNNLISCGHADIINLQDLSKGIHRYHQIVNDKKGTEKERTHILATSNPHGTFLVSKDNNNNLELWDYATGTCINTVDNNDIPFRQNISSVAYDPIKNLLAIGSSADIKLYDFKTNTYKILKGHRGLIQALAFNATGTMLASGSSNAGVKVWDLAKGTCMHTLYKRDNAFPITSVAFNPTGTVLASGDSDGIINLWNPKTGNLLEKFANIHNVESVVFNPSGNLLLSAGKSSNCIIQIWDVEQHKCIYTLSLPANNLFDVNPAHGVSSIALNPTGNLLASLHCNSGGNKNIVWTLISPEIMSILKSGSFRQMLFLLCACKKASLSTEELNQLPEGIRNFLVARNQSIDCKIM